MARISPDEQWRRAERCLCVNCILLDPKRSVLLAESKRIPHWKERRRGKRLADKDSRQ